MSITVLLADDHAVLRQGLRVLLESNDDIKVVGEASNGREAVQKVLNLEPDVVIMDIAMPVLNGIEAMRQILAALPLSKVIILSMYSTSEHVRRSLKAGACGYVIKESAGGDVADAVRTVVTGRRYLSEMITETVLDDYLHQHGPTAVEGPLAQLSDRERQIVQLVVDGKTSQQISTELFLSPKTVDTYRSRAMQKLGITDLTDLIKFAIQQGLTVLY